jgi:hypothetical protein
MSLMLLVLLSVVEMVLEQKQGDPLLTGEMMLLGDNPSAPFLVLVLNISKMNEAEVYIAAGCLVSIPCSWFTRRAVYLYLL